MNVHRNVELQLKQESRKRTWWDAQGAFAEFHEILMHQQTSMRRWELSSVGYFKSPSFDCQLRRGRTGFSASARATSTSPSLFLFHWIHTVPGVDTKLPLTISTMLPVTTSLTSFVRTSIDHGTSSPVNKADPVASNFGDPRSCDRQAGEALDCLHHGLHRNGDAIRAKFPRLLRPVESGPSRSKLCGLRV